MKFNVIRIGNRDFIDLGDSKSFYLDLSMSNKKSDKPTLATVISANNFIQAKFSELQPQERTIYEVSIPDGLFYKEIKRISKLNKKRLKKASEDELTTIDTESYLTEQQFSETQLNQLQELLKVQNKDFVEAVKNNIKINITPPPAPTAGNKKKTTA